MAVDRPGSTNQYHRLALESKWIKSLQTTTPLGINIKGANPLWFHCLVSIYMWSYWSPPPFIILFSQISDHLIIAALPAHVLEAGANAWRRYCRFPLDKGHDVPHVWSGNSGPLFIGLWLFSFFFLFPPLPPCTHFWWCFFLHSPILTSLAAYTSFYPSKFFLSHLPSYTFCHTQFFHTFFHFSSLLFCYANFFYPTCFPFQFFPVHLAVRVCHCLLYLPHLSPLKKSLTFRHVGLYFSPFFPCFPPGGHSNGKRGYQARPWTLKKHPNHVSFMYENRP